ncbi:MAG: branched-chain amino acid ABC transporter permease [Chloroflexi bacterium]|nr:branched-chain amino acid ABC transporter permease [Chloroflexota bacterium]
MLSLYLQFFFSGLTQGSIYALVALGLTIIYQSSALFNFAHGELVVLAAFLMISLLLVAKIPVAVAFLVAVVLVTIVGVVTERVLIRPLYRAPVFVVLLVTMAGSFLIKGVALLIWGTQNLALPALVEGPPLSIGGATIVPQAVVVLLATALLLTGVWFFFERTYFGKALKASAENRVAASLVGINVQRMVVLSFAMSAALGAVAGILIAPITMVNYEDGTLLLLKGISASIFGGLSSLPGAVLGGLLLGLFESYAAATISALFKDAIALVVLLVILLVRPNGLLGKE